jgi:two-component system chemotaxis sensor kinase CheA
MAEPQPTRDAFFESLLGDFLDESAQLLDRLNENLLRLDEWVRALGDERPKRCDEELLNDMFRAVHSLKGLSAMLGLKDINGLTHKVENVLDAARKGQLCIDGDVVELMFQAVDRLIGLVEALKDRDAKPVEYESVAEQIRRVLQAAGAERQQSTQADAERVFEEAPAEAAPSGAGEVSPTMRPTEPAVLPSEPRQPAAIPETPLAAETDAFAGLEDEAEISDQYLALFIDETELSLDEFTETLLAIEGGRNREALEKLMVTSHRIKGSAASVGLNRAAKLAHRMEDVLQSLVLGGGALSAELADALLKCTDGLRQYLDGMRRGGSRSDRFAELARGLAAAQRGSTMCRRSAVPRQSSPPGRAADALNLAPMPAAHVATAGVAASDRAGCSAGAGPSLPAPGPAPLGGNATLLAGEVVFRPNLPLVGLKAQLIYEKLCHLGEVRHFDPPAHRLEQLHSLRSISFVVSTEKASEVTPRQLWVAGVEEVVVRPASAGPGGSAASAASPPAAFRDRAAETAASAARPPAASRDRAAETAAGAAASAEPSGRHPADASGKPTETLRVDIDRLDQLMNLAGELVISRARFSQIADRLKAALAGRQASQALVDVRGSVADLAEAVHQLHRVTDGIHRGVMDTRMVPIGPLFSRFKRLVRDITRSNGKLIRLVVQGEKTELDKRMIDDLADPLIHMIRNSADHGIELPEQRRAAGKPPEGTITLDAFHRGNSIVIQVSDDGQGLDSERILEKAVERGLVSRADAERMTPSQIDNLIWEPGLSTAEKVTEVSGRGMGMDIVKSKIDDLSGTIELDSSPGRGTTITVKLPLTLAILPSLMVDVDGEVFAIPMESVVEIVNLSARDLTTVHGQWTGRVRGRVISLVRLDELLAWHTRNMPDQSRQREETTVVVVGKRGCELGLAVTRVLGQQDVVVRSIAENYRDVAGIAGASVLGDGRVSLILDVAALLDMASHKSLAVATA